VEEMPRKFLARGIEVWWPEEEDRQKGAPAGRAHELRSALDGVRRKRGMTGGSHDYSDKYLGVAWWTLCRSRVDCPRGRCYTCEWHSLQCGGAYRQGNTGTSQERRRVGIVLASGQRGGVPRAKSVRAKLSRLTGLVRFKCDILSEVETFTIICSYTTGGFGRFLR